VLIKKKRKKKEVIVRFTPCIVLFFSLIIPWK